MAPLPLVDDSLVGQNVGGYVVEYLLGEGAMGLVFRAKHPVLNRHFAVKVLRPEFAADASSSSGFVREAQTLSRLKHPAIIDIVGFGSLPDGRQYMVMEYLVGRTLERELLEEGRLEVERALLLADQILDALSAAHSVDVIHRDLKPSNVFLAKVSGGREMVKLLDFGLAKEQPAVLSAREGSTAADSGIAGTPEYIAPEQAYGQPASKQSDLYSFGVMLFRLLTGVLPFEVDLTLPDSQQILALMTKHVNAPPPTLQQAAGEALFPAGLAEIVADLLKKTPRERPSSAETVKKRLLSVARSLQQEATQNRTNPLLEPTLPPVTLPPVALPPVVARRRRSSTRLWAGAGFLLLLVGGTWWWRDRVVRSLPEAAPPAPQAQVRALEPAAPPPEVAAPLAPEEPTAEPLTWLPSLEKPKATPRPPPAPCEPSPQWRKQARADLNELATRAASSTPEITLWAAEREGPLSAAIQAAQDEAACRAVVVQLAAFKQKVSGR